MGKDLSLKDHDELIKMLAWEVSKNIIDHHKNAYKEIFNNAPSTFPISIRNSIYNQISSAIKCKTDRDIMNWITNSELHRRNMRKIRKDRNENH